MGGKLLLGSIITAGATLIAAQAALASTPYIDAAIYSLRPLGQLSPNGFRAIFKVPFLEGMWGNYTGLESNREGIIAYRSYGGLASQMELGTYEINDMSWDVRFYWGYSDWNGAFKFQDISPQGPSCNCNHYWAFDDRGISDTFSILATGSWYSKYVNGTLYYAQDYYPQINSAYWGAISKPSVSMQWLDSIEVNQYNTSNCNSPTSAQDCRTCAQTRAFTNVQVMNGSSWVPVTPSNVAVWNSPYTNPAGCPAGTLYAHASGSIANNGQGVIWFDTSP